MKKYNRLLALMLLLVSICAFGCATDRYKGMNEAERKKAMAEERRKNADADFRMLNPEANGILYQETFYKEETIKMAC